MALTGAPSAHTVCAQHGAKMTQRSPSRDVPAATTIEKGKMRSMTTTTMRTKRHTQFGFSAFFYALVCFWVLMVQMLGMHSTHTNIEYHDTGPSSLFNAPNKAAFTKSDRRGKKRFSEQEGVIQRKAHEHSGRVEKRFPKQEGVIQQRKAHEKPGRVDIVATSTRHKRFPKQKDTTQRHHAAVQTGGDNEAQNSDLHHEIAGLSCTPHGGPNDEIAQEMVYWSDIPSDSTFVSPFKNGGGGHKHGGGGNEVKYLTFEPDEGGFNNIRMLMETVVALAHGMGRTLVLPPERKMYLLNNKGDKKQKKHFSYSDFFPFESLDIEHKGLDVITTDVFLNRVAMTGSWIDEDTGDAMFPPQNRTDWNGADEETRWELNEWLRESAHVPMFQPDTCIAAFPSSSDRKNGRKLKSMLAEIVDEQDEEERISSFVGNPVSVDAPPIDRMRELLGHRSKLCLYNKEMQDARVVHLKMDDEEETRLLVHFYAFLFFQDWRQDLWTKRFIRDHVRYVDDIQCAAARVVDAVRNRSRRNDRNPSQEGLFDTFHIRRGDFQYEETRIEASEIYENSKDVLTEGMTVFIATDERDKNFFKPLAEHYDICFLDDFKHLLGDINTNYYGMLDQLIASRGTVFVGAYFSTFTGYINRMRGYHAQNEDKTSGGDWDGSINSYYYVPRRNKDVMLTYRPITNPVWAREFPVGWRDIDRGIEELHARVEMASA